MSKDASTGYCSPVRGGRQTHLLRRCANDLRACGRVTLTVAGSAADPAAALAPFAPVLETTGSEDVLARRSAVVEAVSERTSGSRGVVAVDDVHLFDRTSAAALQLLVDASEVCLLLSAPAHAALPGPVHRLRTSGCTDLVELAPLTRLDIEHIIDRFPDTPRRDDAPQQVGALMALLGHVTSEMTSRHTALASPTIRAAYDVRLLQADADRR